MFIYVLSRLAVTRNPQPLKVQAIKENMTTNASVAPVAFLIFLAMNPSLSSRKLFRVQSITKPKIPKIAVQK